MTWRAMAAGYLLTVLIETPVLAAGMPARSWRDRLIAGVWLTAVSYPLVWLVVPAFLDPTAQRFAYLAVAETLAPLVECAAFHFGFGKATPRELAAIVLANLTSFLAGELGLSRLLVGL